MDLDPEDAKLVTLARSVRARAESAEGAAVRDRMGRTYAAATVSLTSLQLTALQAAVAAAVSSGAEGFEAAVVVGESPELAPAERDLVAEIGVPSVLLVDPQGAVRA